MKINTCYHEEVELKDTDIITFEKGVPGFEETKRFVLLPLTDDRLYSALQSVEEPGLAFIVTNPFIFFNEYEFVLEEPIKRNIKIEDTSSIETYVVLTVADPFEKTTANLQGPIVLNRDTMLAQQVIVNSSNYGTRHKLPMPEKVKGVK